MRLWFRLQDGGILCPVWWPPVIWSYRGLLYLLIAGAVITGDVSMFADLDTYVYIAICIGAFFGALIYSAACYLNRFQEQRLKSARILAQAASEGRELTDAEKQQTDKTETFAGVYLAALVLVVILGAGLGAVALILFGDGLGFDADNWAEYGLAAFIVAFALAVVFEKWVATPIADASFDKTKSKVYDAIVAATKSTDSEASASAIPEKYAKLIAVIKELENSE